MNIYETHTMADPRVPFIFHDTTLDENKRSSTYNWHENIEIICVAKGDGSVVIDGERVDLSEGDICVINPNRLHGFVSYREKFRYFCLIIDRSFFLANHFDSNNFYFSSKVNDREIVELIKKFEECWIAEKKEQPMKIQKLRGLALDISLALCERHAIYNTDQKSESHMMSCIKQAIGYIRAESHRDISLDDISEFVGVSKYYFAREFRRITGYSFVSYLNIVRCEKAKELLLEERRSVGEIGRICGFANQSYFTRTFCEHTGSTPTAYRKGNKS